MRRFFWRWLTTAFSRPWAITSLAAGILSLVIPAGMKLFQVPDVSDLIWLLPLGIFLILILPWLGLSPWWMHKEDEQKSNESIARIEAERKAAQDEVERLRGELSRKRDEFDQRPTDPEGIREHLRQLGLEGRRILHHGGNAQEWLERANRIVKDALQPRHYELFLEIYTAENRNRLHECSDWLVNLRIDAVNRRYKIPPT